MEDQLKLAFPIIERTVERILKQFAAEDREDAQQEITLAVWQKVLPAFDPARGDLVRFLKRAVRNLTVNVYHSLMARRRPNRNVREDDATGTDLGSTDRLALALTAHPHQYLPKSKADQLRDVHQAEDTNELAERWKISRGAADKRVSRLREDVRQLAA